MKYSPGKVKPRSDALREDQEGADKAKTVVEGNGKLDFGEYELELWDSRYNNMLGGRRSGWGSEGGGRSGLWKWIKPVFVPIAIIITLSLLIVIIALLDDTLRQPGGNKPRDMCRFELVETVPQNLTFPPESPIHPSIYGAWIELLNTANRTIDIAAFYWTLLNEDVSPLHFPSSSLGEDVFKRLKKTGLKEGMKIRIAQNAPNKANPQKDSAILASLGAAKVRNVDFKRLMNGGVLHTKMWIVDDLHIYIGSANMDWRSLTQVKEVGIVISNCSSLALDMKKIFEVYWKLGEDSAVIPPSWPPSLHTHYNIDHQMPLSLSGYKVNSYLSSSPPPFCPEGRSSDSEAIIDIINKAEKFVYVSVMEYFPKTIYEYRETQFWPLIDDALRGAAISRGVRVRLLASLWNHTRSDQALYLRSLSVLSSSANGVDIDARLFVVPSYTPEQEKVPFGRVNHDKYMVTDQVAYIGTSNWSADYFIDTGGIGLVINETQISHRGATGEMKPRGNEGKATGSVRQQLQALFERDWDSEYAKPLLDVP